VSLVGRFNNTDRALYDLAKGIFDDDGSTSIQKIRNRYQALRDIPARLAPGTDNARLDPGKVAALLGKKPLPREAFKTLDQVGLSELSLEEDRKMLTTLDDWQNALDTNSIITMIADAFEKAHGDIDRAYTVLEGCMTGGQRKILSDTYIDLVQRTRKEGEMEPEVVILETPEVIYRRIANTIISSLFSTDTTFSLFTYDNTDDKVDGLAKATFPPEENLQKFPDIWSKVFKEDREKGIGINEMSDMEGIETYNSLDSLNNLVKNTISSLARQRKAAIERMNQLFDLNETSKPKLEELEKANEKLAIGETQYTLLVWALSDWLDMFIGSDVFTGLYPDSKVSKDTIVRNLGKFIVSTREVERGSKGFGEEGKGTALDTFLNETATSIRSVLTEVTLAMKKKNDTLGTGKKQYTVLLWALRDWATQFTGSEIFKLVTETGLGETITQGFDGTYTYSGTPGARDSIGFGEEERYLSLQGLLERKKTEVLRGLKSAAGAVEKKDATIDTGYEQYTLLIRALSDWTNRFAASNLPGWSEDLKSGIQRGFEVFVPSIGDGSIGFGDASSKTNLFAFLPPKLILIGQALDVANTEFENTSTRLANGENEYKKLAAALESWVTTVTGWEFFNALVGPEDLFRQAVVGNFTAIKDRTLGAEGGVEDLTAFFDIKGTAVNQYLQHLKEKYAEARAVEAAEHLGLANKVVDALRKFIFPQSEKLKELKEQLGPVKDMSILRAIAEAMQDEATFLNENIPVWTISAGQVAELERQLKAAKTKEKGEAMEVESGKLTELRAENATLKKKLTDVITIYIGLRSSIVDKFRQAGYTAEGFAKITDTNVRKTLAGSFELVESITGFPGHTESAIQWFWQQFVKTADIVDMLLGTIRSSVQREDRLKPGAPLVTATWSWVRPRDGEGRPLTPDRWFELNRSNESTPELPFYTWDQTVKDLKSLVRVYEANVEQLLGGSQEAMEKLIEVINWVSNAVQTLEADSKGEYPTLTRDGEEIPFPAVYPVESVDIPSETPLVTTFAGTKTSRDNLIWVLDAIKEQFKRSIDERQRAGVGLMEERDGLAKDNSGLWETIGEKEAKIDELNDAIDETNERVEQLSGEKDRAFEEGKQATRRELEPTITNLGKNNDALTQDLRKCRNERTALTTKQGELEASITDLERQLQVSEESVEQWERNYSTLQAILTATQTELSDVQASIGEKDEEMTSLTQKLQKQRILLGSFPSLKNAAAQFWSEDNLETIVGISNAVSDTPMYVKRVTNLAGTVHEDFQTKVYETLRYTDKSAIFPTDLRSELVSEEEFLWMPGLLTAVIALTAASDTLYSTWRMISRNTLSLLIQAVPSVFYLLMTCKLPQSFTDSTPITAWQVSEEGGFVRQTRDISIRGVLNRLFFDSRFAEAFNSILPEEMRVGREQIRDDGNFGTVVRNSPKWAEFMEKKLTEEQFSSLEGIYSTTANVELLNHLLEGIALSALLERKLAPRREKRRAPEEGPAERPRVRRRPAPTPAIETTGEEGDIDIIGASIKTKDNTWDMWLS
jgi:predicted  nucleic acid-binding Zn-ribbon protein